MGNPSQSYGSSLAIWDHTVLPATRHKWTRATITPANQAGTRFTYPGGMEGWVDLGSLIAARLGIKSTTSWSQVRRLNRYATKPPTLSSFSASMLLVGRQESLLLGTSTKTKSERVNWISVTCELINTDWLYHLVCAVAEMQSVQSKWSHSRLFV